MTMKDNIGQLTKFSVKTHIVGRAVIDWSFCISISRKYRDLSIRIDLF